MTADQRMLGEPRRYVERIEALEAENAELRAGAKKADEDAYARGYMAGYRDRKDGRPVNVFEERPRAAVGDCRTCGRTLPRLGPYYLPCVPCSILRSAYETEKEA